MKISLVTSFFFNSNIRRQKEYELTLHRNLEKDFISKIYLFITDNDHKKFMKTDFAKNSIFKKICFNIAPQQPTYKDFIEYASTLDDDGICMITNSDIELSKIDENILKHLNNNRIAYILTRHEEDGTKPLINDYRGSHDCILFNVRELKKNFKSYNLDLIDITQNNYGSEALLTLCFIETLKFKLFNPCFQIKIIHHHTSNIRQNYKYLAYTALHKSTAPHYKNSIHNRYLIYPQVIKN